MKILELKKASKALAEYAARLGAEPIVITSNKKLVAALVPLQGAEQRALPLSLNPAFMRIIARARAQASRGEVYSLEQVKQETVAEASGSHRPLRRRVAARD